MSKTRAVPLTAKVVRGLAMMKAACSAAPQETLFGHDNPMSKEEKAEFSAYEAAVKWIESQQEKREAKP